MDAHHPIPVYACPMIGRSSSCATWAFRWERQLCIYISVHWVLTIYNARVCKTRCSPRMCPGDRSSRCRFGTAGSPERITNHTGEVMVNCHNAMHEPQLEGRQVVERGFQLVIDCYVPRSVASQIPNCSRPQLSQQPAPSSVQHDVD